MEKLDQLYLTISQEVGGIDGLLHSFFSFLYRRTDFYYEADPNDNMGFPPGVAEQMLIKVFRGYQNEYYKKNPKKSIEEFKKKAEKMKKEEEIKTQKKEINKQDQIKQSPQNIQKESIKKEINTSQQQQKQLQKQNNEVQHLSCYNGGKTQNYRWSQSVREVIVEVEFDRPIKGKDLQITIHTKKLKVYDKVKKQVIIEGELYDKVKSEDSIWTIEEQKLLFLNLEKNEENIWKTVIIGDEEIDTSKVDNSKKLEEFDEETQGALRKVMYEQNRKQRGLPTTEEEEQQNLLKKAWNAEGSPFKGQPFDPSKFNIPSNQFMKDQFK